METKTNKPKVSKEFHLCRCFAVETGETYEQIVDNNTGATEDTGVPIYGACSANTRREFAPGHDAKLKGALIKAYRNGTEYHYTDGGMLISCDPIEEARKRGWSHFLVAPSGKVASRVTEAKPVSTATKGHRIPSSVKVGRWTHGVTKVVASAGDTWTVQYKTAKGETKEITVNESKLEF